MSDVSSKDHIQKSLDGTDRQGFFIAMKNLLLFITVENSFN